MEHRFQFHLTNIIHVMFYVNDDWAWRTEAFGKLGSPANAHSQAKAFK